MKVSAIPAISADECRPRRNLFIRFSNSFMSSPEVENPIEKANAINPVERPSKMGIENLLSAIMRMKGVVILMTEISYRNHLIDSH